MESWKQSGLAAVVVFLAILAGSGLQSWSLDEGSAASVATPVAATTIPSVVATTGIPDLDRLIAILTSGDVAAVKAILIEMPSPCVVNPRDIQNPPACPDGVAAGTLLPVFRASAGEAVWPGQLDQGLPDSVAQNRTLYGVQRSGPTSQQWIPAGNFMIVLGDAARTSSSTYFVTSSGVVGAIFVPWMALAGVVGQFPSRGDIVPLDLAGPTPAAASSVTEVPIGIDWSHRLAVYTGQVTLEQTGTRSIPVRNVVTWDVTAGKLAATFEYSGSGAYPVGVALAGHDVVFATEHQVVETSLDGTAPRRVFAAGDGDIVQDSAVSPDGRMLAVVVTPKDMTQPAGVLHVIDLQTLQDRLVVQRSDSRLTGLRGYFWQVQWRADATGVLVGTGTQTEMWGALITVFLDGRVRIEDVQGYGNVSPTGSMRAGDVGQVQCMFVGAHQIVVRNLDTGDTPLSLGGPSSSTVYSPWEWSPDGSQFVFLQQEATTCEELSSGKQVAYVAQTNGTSFPGAPVRASDLATLHRDWYGDNLFTADCDHGNEPVVDRMGHLRPLCFLEGGPGPYHAVNVRVGGQAIGTAVEPEPVGVITP